jgi:hypothetical protein
MIRRKSRKSKFKGFEFGPKLKGADKKALIDKADRAFSTLVRKRDRMCLYCKRVHDHNKLYCHHIFSRKHMGTRFDEKNSVTLCWTCHDGIAHTDPEIFRDWLIERIGQKEYDRLKVKAMGRVKFTASDLTMILFDLKKKLKEVSK